jgi:hypothetical protein
MRIHTIALILMAALLSQPGSSAQTPVSMPAPGLLLQATLDEVAPDNLTAIGITRTTYESNGAMRVTAGSGPMVSWVESGSVTLSMDEGLPPAVIVRTGTTLEPAAGSVSMLAAGDGFVLAAGSAGHLRNDSAAPSVVLDLISALDARRQPGDGVDQAVVMNTEKTLPDAPATVMFSVVILESGQSVTLPPAPAVGIFAAVDKAEVFHVTGSGFNRFTKPVAVYVLTIAPA